MAYLEDDKAFTWKVNEELYAHGKKKCSKCGQVKSVGMFKRDTEIGTPDGLHPRCKDCLMLPVRIDAAMTVFGRVETASQLGEFYERFIYLMGGPEGAAVSLHMLFNDPRATIKNKIDLWNMFFRIGKYIDEVAPKQVEDYSKFTPEQLGELLQANIRQLQIENATPATTEPIEPPKPDDAQPPPPAA